MALATWQYYMKDWEVRLENNLTEIAYRAKIKEDKVKEIVELLKEFEILKD